MFHLKVFLPRNRYNAGMLRLFSGPAQDYEMDAPCLGKADNGRAIRAGNPDRDPAKPYGDTPTGEYVPTRYVPFAEPHPRLGKGWIPLTGDEGQAYLAVRGGRTGLGIHAGRGDERLVPTYGCLRMKDSDFDRLTAIVGSEEIRVEIFEGDA